MEVPHKTTLNYHICYMLAKLLASASHFCPSAFGHPSDIPLSRKMRVIVVFRHICTKFACIIVMPSISRNENGEVLWHIKLIFKCCLSKRKSANLSLAIQ